MSERSDLQKSGEQMVIALIGGTAAGIFIQAPLLNNTLLAVGVSVLSGFLLSVFGIGALYGTRLITSDDAHKEGEGIFIYIIIGKALFILVVIANIFGITRFAG